jgi:single-strand DNA-binding protein
MASLNKFFGIGNLVRDPEMRVTPKGTAICQFGMALNRSFKDDSGATRDETTFIDCEAWGKTGELVAKYLMKGVPCMVEGRLKLDQWEDKASGQKRSRIKVVVDNVQFLGSPKGKREEADSDTHTEMNPPPGRKPSAPASNRDDNPDF